MHALITRMLVASICVRARMSAADIVSTSASMPMSLSAHISLLSRFTAAAADAAAPPGGGVASAIFKMWDSGGSNSKELGNFGDDRTYRIRPPSSSSPANQHRRGQGHGLREAVIPWARLAPGCRCRAANSRDLLGDNNTY